MTLSFTNNRQNTDTITNVKMKYRYHEERYDEIQISRRTLRRNTDIMTNVKTKYRYHDER
jgi:hypothetical protein